MKKKRLAALLLTAAIALTGCGGTGGGSGTEGASESAQTESTQADGTQDGEKVTLTIATQPKMQVLDWDTNYMTQIIEEKFNVEIEIMQLPADDAEMKQKLSLMVSSGEKLPDVIMTLGIGANDSYLFGKSGALIPVNEYLENETMSPCFHENIPEEDRAYMLECLTSADGNIYGLGEYIPEAGNQNALRAWINQTWLDELGLDMPETTEDFYNVLKAFKEQDPNGNGKADEVPMTGSPSGWYTNPIPYLMNAFIYCDPKNNYFYAEDGQITPAFVQDEWKEGLAYVNRLVSEDLLSPASFTQDWNQVQTMAENEDAAVIGSVVAGIPPYTAGSDRYEDIDVLPPLTGPEGVCWATYFPTVPYPCWMITKDCENPELAFRIGEYGYDQEMSMIARYGEPGVDWDTNVEGLVCPYEESLGVKPGFRELNGSLRGNPQNSFWDQGYPQYRGMLSSMSVQGLAVDPETTDRFNIIMPKSVGFYKDRHPEEIITRYLQTEEEMDELSMLRTDIDTYVKESMVRFATGEMPLTEWDNYVETLEGMGLDRYTQLLQAGYDRANGQ